MFPLYLRSDLAKRSLFEEEDPRDLGNGLLINLSEAALRYLAALDPAAEKESLFYHALAVLHSPAYAAENAGALRQDWPRIPLPASRAALDASAALGRRVAALLDTETPVPGVTTGSLRPELHKLGAVSRVGGGNLNPARDLALTAGWGHAGKGGITMPARGKTVTRPYTSEDWGLPADGSGNPGSRDDADAALAALGDSTRDVYLNDVMYWRNVPERVWTYTIGGYQVMKKWLSYREQPLLGRSLTREEAREVSDMVRRIAALLLLGPELDANYGAAKADAWPWASDEKP